MAIITDFKQVKKISIIDNNKEVPVKKIWRVTSQGDQLVWTSVSYREASDGTQRQSIDEAHFTVYTEYEFKSETGTFIFGGDIITDYPDERYAGRTVYRPGGLQYGESYTECYVYTDLRREEAEDEYVWDKPSVQSGTTGWPANIQDYHYSPSPGEVRTMPAKACTYDVGNWGSSYMVDYEYDIHRVELGVSNDVTSVSAGFVGNNIWQLDNVIEGQTLQEYAYNVDKYVIGSGLENKKPCVDLYSSEVRAPIYPDTDNNIYARTRSVTTTYYWATYTAIKIHHDAHFTVGITRHYAQELY